jgi:hypothetical protein
MAGLVGLAVVDWEEEEQAGGWIPGTEFTVLVLVRGLS